MVAGDSNHQWWPGNLYIELRCPSWFAWWTRICSQQCDARSRRNGAQLDGVFEDLGEPSVESWPRPWKLGLREREHFFLLLEFWPPTPSPLISLGEAARRAKPKGEMCRVCANAALSWWSGKLNGWMLLVGRLRQAFLIPSHWQNSPIRRGGWYTRHYKTTSREKKYRDRLINLETIRGRPFEPLA